MKNISYIKILGLISLLLVLLIPFSFAGDDGEYGASLFGIFSFSNDFFLMQPIDLFLLYDSVPFIFDGIIYAIILVSSMRLLLWEKMTYNKKLYLIPFGVSIVLTALLAVVGFTLFSILDLIILGIIFVTAILLFFGIRTHRLKWYTRLSLSYLTLITLLGAYVSEMVYSNKEFVVPLVNLLGIVAILVIMCALVFEMLRGTKFQLPSFRFRKEKVFEAEESIEDLIEIKDHVIAKYVQDMQKKTNTFNKAFGHKKTRIEKMEFVLEQLGTLEKEQEEMEHLEEKVVEHYKDKVRHTFLLYQKALLESLDTLLGKLQSERTLSPEVIATMRKLTNESDLLVAYKKKTRSLGIPKKEESTYTTAAKKMIKDKVNHIKKTGDKFRKDLRKYNERVAKTKDFEKGLQQIEEQTKLLKLSRARIHTILDSKKVRKEDEKDLTEKVKKLVASLQEKPVESKNERVLCVMAETVANQELDVSEEVESLTRMIDELSGYA